MASSVLLLEHGCGKSELGAGNGRKQNISGSTSGARAVGRSYIESGTPGNGAGPSAGTTTVMDDCREETGSAAREQKQGQQRRTYKNRVRYDVTKLL